MTRVRPVLTPQSLFDWATAFAKKHEDAGRGTKYPTFRQAAKRFGVKICDIEDACADWTGPGYMSAAVGFRAYNGIGLYEHIGDYEVEAYA